MTFLPIVERELRIAARRRGTYWARFSAALVVLLLAGFILLEQRNASNFQLSESLFYTISTFAFIFCLAGGGSLTSDCLSEEKRDGTLGLLFLTDLKGYDVVFGKLVATSLNSIYRLIAVLPALAIPLILGGLTPGQFWRMSLVLTNTLFFSLSTGLFASSISRNQRKALSLAVILVFFVTGGPFLFEGLYGYSTGGVFEPKYLLPSLGYAFWLCDDQHYKAAPNYFVYSTAITFGISLAWLALASLIVPRSWKDRPAGAVQSRWQDRWKRWSYGSPQTRARFRKKLLDQNPYYWLAARHRLKPFYVLTAMGFIAAIWTWAAFRFRQEMFDLSIYILICVLVHSILKVWLASESAATLAEERRAGSLELLLSTPIRVDEILRGQFLAVRRQFVVPVALALALDLVVFFAGRNASGSDIQEWVLLWLAGTSIFVADLFTLLWVAMWLGLISRKSNLATRGATTRILILPWSLFFGILILASFANGFANRPRFPTPTFFILLWFLISLMVDVGFFLWAWGNLHQHFRETSAKRFEKAKSGWFAWFGSDPGKTNALDRSSVKMEA